MLIHVNRIQFPRHYIREKVNREIVKTWAADLKEKGHWFFPPLEVWVPPDGLLEGKTHELIDGNKRLSAALDAGIEKVPCTPLTFKSPVDAFARQYVANAEHGEFLNKTHRNHYVQVMRSVFKLNLAAIGKITKLSKAQVSRIARGIKAVSGGGKPRPSAAFTVQSFLDSLLAVCESFDSHDKSVEKYCSEKYGKTVGTKITEALATVYETLTEAMKATEEEAAAGQEA